MHDFCLFPLSLRLSLFRHFVRCHAKIASRFCQLVELLALVFLSIHLEALYLHWHYKNESVQKRDRRSDAYMHIVVGIITFSLFPWRFCKLVSSFENTNCFGKYQIHIQCKNLSSVSHNCIESLCKYKERAVANIPRMIRYIRTFRTVQVIMYLLSWNVSSLNHHHTDWVSFSSIEIIHFELSIC